jgi:hypothetical protein
MGKCTGRRSTSDNDLHVTAVVTLELQCNPILVKRRQGSLLPAAFWAWRTGTAVSPLRFLSHPKTHNIEIRILRRGHDIIAFRLSFGSRSARVPVTFTGRQSVCRLRLYVYVICLVPPPHEERNASICPASFLSVVGLFPSGATGGSEPHGALPYCRCIGTDTRSILRLCLLDAALI